MKIVRENEVWKIIDKRCDKWQYVFDFSSSKDKRLKILDELLKNRNLI